MSCRRVGSVLTAGLVIIGSLLTAAPAAAKGHVDVLLDGLASPKAIFAGPHSVFVGQGWIGPPGPVLEYSLTGRARGTAREVTPPVAVGDITGTPDGAGWAIAYVSETSVALVRQAAEGAPIETILDFAAYQAADLDPFNNDSASPGETNPNGLAPLPNNDVLVADAAGNDLIRVSPDGTARTVARWALQDVGTDHLGDPSLPPTLPAEAVPTTVAMGRDGWAYVGELVGFPGKPGSAHIWRVNPNATNALCSVAAPNANCSVWKSGFTSIFDIAFSPKTGTLYVYEIAKDGWLSFEPGFANGDFPPAVLLEVKGKRIRELVPGELSEPGGVAVTRDGSIYVTDGAIGIFGSHGRLLKIRGS
jgi:hypothetical protein